MLRLAKIVRFPERHYPSTVVDGAGALLLCTGLAVFISTSPFMDLWRPTVRDSISRGRDNGLLGSRHAVFADGRLGSHALL